MAFEHEDKGNWGRQEASTETGGQRGQRQEHKESVSK